METNTFYNSYEQAYQDLPVKWYEKEVNRDWAFVLSALAIMFPFVISILISIKEQQIYDSQIWASAISLYYFSSALLFDKYTTYKGFSLSDKLEDKKIESPISELNLDLQHVTTANEYLNSVVRYKDVIALLLSVLPILGIPMATQRVLAGLNNMRVIHRVENAYNR